MCACGCSEELLDLTYHRYIQAKYMETMSRKAYHQTEQVNYNYLTYHTYIQAMSRKAYHQTEQVN